jgi:protoporphyrinogen oxidase
MSRILYRGKLFDYPLKPFNALFGLGVLEAVRCVLSYALVRVRPPKDQSNFEGWVAARFGWRLYRIFFKTYTEKVWGVPATDIQATGRRSGSRTCRCSTPSPRPSGSARTRRSPR